MRIASTQFTSTSDIHENLASAHKMLLEAVQRGADLIAFPENFAYFGDFSSASLKAFFKNEDHLMIVETLQEWAVEYGIWILGGSIPLPAKGKKQSTKILPYNASLLISPEGKICGQYNKIHLFDVTLEKEKKYHESKLTAAGSSPCAISTPWAKMGLSICYDLRFPELYRMYAKQKCDILFIPAAFTAKTGQAHWDVLTRARAIENQCYVVAPAQWGKHPHGRETWGHSRIIDPWGRIIAERPGGTGIVVADLNFSNLAKIRKEMPVLKHMKLF